MSIEALVDREVEAVRASVAATIYPPDPVLGAVSRASSMAQAFVRRHGMLAATVLGHTIDRLSAGRLEVLHEYTVPLTRVAADLVSANARERLATIDLPPEATWTGTYRLDLVVISEELGIAWIVEVKRANAATKGHRLKGMLRQLDIARLSALPILRGSYRISRVESLLVSLYGDSSCPDILDRKSLDEFFGLPIEAELDRLDAVYRAMVERELGSRVRSDLALTDIAQASAHRGAGRSAEGASAAFGDDHAGGGETEVLPSARPADLFRVRPILSEPFEEAFPGSPIANGGGRLS
jgi:hypothetical protein